MRTHLYQKRYCPNCTKVEYDRFDATYAGYSENPVYLVLRNGKFGKFFGCPNFPRCKYNEPIVEKKEVFIDFEDELRPY